MIKAIFFDLGNTLANVVVLNTQAKTKIDMQLLKSLGYNVGENEITEALKKTDDFIETRYRGNSKKTKKGLFFKTMCKMLGKEIDDKTAEEKDILFWKFLIKKSKLMPNSIRVLKYLKNENIKTVIISNGTRDEINKLIDHLGLRKYFDLIIISEDVGYEKCTTIPFKIALKKLNLKPEEVIMVGDRIDEDVLGAKKIGIKTIKFNFGFQKDMNYDNEKIESDFEIDDLIQVKDILHKILGKL